MNKVNKYINRFGRILFSLIFIASGISKIGEWDKTVAYMEAHGMILVPVFLILAILLQTMGGLAILFNYKLKLGAFLLLGFLVPTTLIFHNFWQLPIATDIERIVQEKEMVSFLKNTALIGALLYMISLPKLNQTNPLAS